MATSNYHSSLMSGECLRSRLERIRRRALCLWGFCISRCHSLSLPRSSGRQRRIGSSRPTGKKMNTRRALIPKLLPFPRLLGNSWFK